MPIFRIIFLCLITIPAFSQPGIPYIQNYTKNNYRAAGRNWAVTTNSGGDIYVGNSAGLLSFNGAEWQQFPLPENKMVRSAMCHDDNRIYTGSFEEFGFFERDVYGELHYISLSDSLDNFNFHNDEIWNIVAFKGKIYFRSFSSYFTYDGQQVRAYSLPFTMSFLTNIGDGAMYAHILDKGFYRFDGANFEILLTEDQLNHDVVVGVQPLGEKELLLFTAQNGVFVYNGHSCIPWENELNDLLKQTVINRTIMTKDSVYVIGTITDGIYAVDKKGRLEWKINVTRGLANNTVLSLACDMDDNIWAALDDGLSYIRNNSRLRFVNTFGRPVGYVYSAALQNNYLYQATNQGVFYSKGKDWESNIELIDNLAGQAWDLSIIDGQLLCGHNEGTFLITGEKAEKISEIKGGTSIRKGIIHGQEILLQSTYTYLVIYKKAPDGKWKFSHIVNDFMHPIRSIEIDNQGNVWAKHFYKGLYCIKLSSDLKDVENIRFIESLDPTQKNKTIYLFKLRGRIVCSNDQHFYTFDDLTDKIEPFDYLNEHFPGKKDVRHVVAVNDDTYWMVHSNEFVLVEFKDKKISVLQRIPFSFLYNALPDKDENILPVSENEFIFCMNNGIAIWDNNLNIYISDRNKRMKLEKIETLNNKKEIRLLPLFSKEDLPEVKYTFNDFIFHVSYPAFSGEEVRYAFRLDPLDKEWAEPSLQPVKEYGRLYPGKYTLYIKTIDNLGNELDSIQYPFRVNPPFYASLIAIILYCLLAIGCLFFIYFQMRRHVLKKQLKIKQEHEELRKKESEQQEREIMRLQNEKLEADLTFKSKELAGSTMSIIKKNEILAEIKKELTEQKEKLAAQYPNKYYEKLMKMIDSNLSSEDDWLVFQSNFDRIHENFFRSLKSHYPDLTSTDLKFCAYLRLNLNTKEIANLMNISVKGVEVGRYRLRKKLGLASDMSLVDFMIGLK